MKSFCPLFSYLHDFFFIFFLAPSSFNKTSFDRDRKTLYFLSWFFFNNITPSTFFHGFRARFQNRIYVGFLSVLLLIKSNRDIAHTKLTIFPAQVTIKSIRFISHNTIFNYFTYTLSGEKLRVGAHTRLLRSPMVILENRSRHVSHPLFSMSFHTLQREC